MHSGPYDDLVALLNHRRRCLGLAPDVPRAPARPTGERPERPARQHSCSGTGSGSLRLAARALGFAADLGYHIATMLSLHEWFAEIHSPAPRFLILDQPSQAGFPDETRDGGFGTARATLRNLYKTIQASVEALRGGFQVIVVEHAGLDDATLSESHKRSMLV